MRLVFEAGCRCETLRFRYLNVILFRLGRRVYPSAFCFIWLLLQETFSNGNGQPTRTQAAQSEDV
jgi:hypothetical protein